MLPCAEIVLTFINRPTTFFYHHPWFTDASGQLLWPSPRASNSVWDSGIAPEDLTLYANGFELPRVDKTREL